MPALQRSEKCVQNSGLSLFLKRGLVVFTYFPNKSNNPLYPNFSVDEDIQLIRTDLRCQQYTEDFFKKPKMTSIKGLFF